MSDLPLRTPGGDTSGQSEASQRRGSHQAGGERNKPIFSPLADSGIQLYKSVEP